MNCYRFVIKDMETGNVSKEWFLASDSLTKKDFHNVITGLYLWQLLLRSTWIVCRIYRNGEWYTDIDAVRDINGLYIMRNIQTIRFIHI